jgi:hypothetical protein
MSSRIERINRITWSGANLMKSASVRSRFTRVVAIAATTGGFAAASVVASCGSGTEPVVKVVPKDTVPTAITATTTGTLTAQVGTTVNTVLEVLVANKTGQPVGNALVTFATGGGTVSNPTLRTDTTGKASTTWTLGSAVGTQTVTATVGTLAPVTFTATATVGAQTTLTKVTGDNQTAAAGANVAVAPSVKVVDKFGNPVPNVPVAFTANNGGSVSGGSPVTDANGVATVASWRLGTTVGANTLTAVAASITTPVTFTATGTVGAVSRVNITSAAIPTLQIGQTSTITAQAFDANGNAVSNATFTFSSDNTAIATVSSAGVVTAVGAGTATITVASNGATATRTVTVIGHPGVSVSATVQLSGRPRRVITAGTTVYSQTSTAGAVVAVNTVAGAIAWADTLGGNVTDVAVNAANTLVTAVSTGANGTPMFYMINPSTHKTTDSVSLNASPVRMVMNSAGTRAFVDENDFNMEIIDIPSKSVVSTIVLPGTINAMKFAANDQAIYAGATLGNVFELDPTTGAVKRQFQPSNTVVDLDVSVDGKTLLVSDGSPSIFMIRLATGGLSGTLSFGVPPTNNISGVALSPDNKQLWVSMGTVLVAAPSDNAGSFDTGIVQGRTTVNGANLTRIAFLKDGSGAVVIDDASLSLVIFK